jgi:DNA-binding response OmpR family regulator
MLTSHSRTAHPARHRAPFRLPMTSRILVVDDSPTIRRVVSAILERHGYEAALASDGEDALHALQSGEVKADLILLDFVMPRMNGYQFCRALRADVELSMTPVVLMSAKSDRIRDQFVQQTGAMDAITKPFDAQALVAVVENALRRVNSGRSSSTRLPDLDPDEPAPPPLELETRRTHVAQIVATKLAHIVTKTMADRPHATPGELASALTERLAKDALLEMVEAVRDLERGGESSGSVLSGDLGVVPIGAILQLLQVENQSGVLVCRSGTADVVATFRKGLIDLVQSSGAGDEFRLGRYFVEEGIVTPAQIDDAMKRSRPGDANGAVVSDDAEGPSSRVTVRNDVPTPGPTQLGSDPMISVKSPDTEREDPHARVTMPGLPPSMAGRASLVPGSQPPATDPDPRRRLLGATLLAFGKITESQLRTALTRQSSELLYEVLRWPTGRFDFRAEPASDVVESAQLGLPVASVVMEGFRRVDEWRVLERTIGSFDGVLVRDDLALRSIDMGTLPAKEKAVLDAVDGARSVRAIVAASHMSSFDACRVLVQFLEARVLRRRAA